MAYDWFTTSPHPTRPAHTHGADQGQVGWRLHIVDLASEPFTVQRGREISRAKALCGLRAKHGWGVDMFIDEPCERCVKKAEQLGIEQPD